MVFVLTLLVHVVGSSILACVIGGLSMVLATPFMALLGWFMLLPEFAIVTLQWETTKRKWFASTYAWLITVFAACVAFTCLAPKEQGSIMQWTIGYALGSLIAFSLSFATIHFHLKSRLVNRDKTIKADPSCENAGQR